MATLLSKPREKVRTSEAGLEGYLSDGWTDEDLKVCWEFFCQNLLINPLSEKISHLLTDCVTPK